ncbi:MAG TPA: threonylcarbamoyl-AMP synthase [Nitrospinae bacterium]|nr:threonylcarbamoyl-AMP synthase [Nitrospinota bacterium]HBA26174.1 threonylcarbamoyl-AMP synthase [Nitrospinota bacterium]
MRIVINRDFPQPRLIKKVVQILKDGRVIAYPTDTIYGIGCDIFNKKGIEKIYQIKKREKNKPMSFICADLSDISQYAIVSNYAYRIMKRSLPGPYTFILEASSITPKKIMSKKKTVGIRIPDHKICLAVVKELGHPLITTSANISTEEELNNPDDIEDKLGSSLDLIIDEGPLISEPSTIVDLTGDSPIILREGKGEIKKITG